MIHLVDNSHCYQKNIYISLQKSSQVPKKASPEIDKAGSHVDESPMHEDNITQEPLQVSLLNGRYMVCVKMVKTIIYLVSFMRFL